MLYFMHRYLLHIPKTSGSGTTMPLPPRVSLARSEPAGLPAPGRARKAGGLELGQELQESGLEQGRARQAGA